MTHQQHAGQEKTQQSLGNRLTGHAIPVLTTPDMVLSGTCAPCLPRRSTILYIALAMMGYLD
jgi:hypothetical protein